MTPGKHQTGLTGSSSRMILTGFQIAMLNYRRNIRNQCKLNLAFLEYEVTLHNGLPQCLGMVAAG